MAASDGLDGGPDDLIVVALARGDTFVAAGRAVGVSVSTVRRRMADPAFRARVSRARGALVDEAAGQASAALTRAISTLTQLLSSRNESVALGAASRLIDTVLRLREHVEIEERITSLEERKAGHVPVIR